MVVEQEGPRGVVRSRNHTRREFVQGFRAEGSEPPECGGVVEFESLR